MDHDPIPAEPTTPSAVPATAPAIAAPSAQDLAHLDTIGILYYVLAGITAVFSLLPVIHLIVGIGMLALPAQPGAPGQTGHEAALVGWLFIAVAVSLIGFGMTLAVLFLMVARRLRQRRGYMFCVVASAVSCLSMPFGTALGVFSLIVLTKAPVKALFDSAPAINR